jgi:hypothetical protein
MYAKKIYILNAQKKSDADKFYLLLYLALKSEMT